MELAVVLGVSCYAQAGTGSLSAGQGVEKIYLKVGQSVSRELRSLPGAGFLWMVKNYNPVNREVIHIEKDSKPAEEGLIGGPVKEFWTFKAMQPGHARIILEYLRPSDPSTVSDTLTLDFDVEVGS
jgi:predicted secreted protein